MRADLDIIQEWIAPGSRVLLSRSTNPLRKLSYSWELVEVALRDLGALGFGGKATLVAAHVVRSITDEAPVAGACAAGTMVQSAAAKAASSARRRNSIPAVILR